MAGQFAQDLKRFENKVIGREDLFLKKLTMEILRKLVLRTPVDTGRARANWNVEFGAPDPSVTEDTDKTGGSTTAEGVSLLTGAEAGGKIFITNNLVYIVPLEEGSSKQAPHGMVAVTLREFEGMVETVAGKVKVELP